MRQRLQTTDTRVRAQNLNRRDVGHVLGESSRKVVEVVMNGYSSYYGKYYGQTSTRFAPNFRMAQTGRKGINRE